jgi:hypothetical protein
LRLLGTAEVEDQRRFTYKQEGDETKASIHNATKYALNCASLQAHVVALGVAVVAGLISPSVAKECMHMPSYKISGKNHIPNDIERQKYDWK